MPLFIFAAVGIVVIWAWMRAGGLQWDLFVLVERQKVVKLHGIAANKRSEARSFFENAIEVPGTVWVKARPRYDRTWEFRFSKNVDTFTQQRIRNFLLNFIL